MVKWILLSFSMIALFGCASVPATGEDVTAPMLPIENGERKQLAVTQPGLGDWPTWVGAFGTVLTLAGTIWIATNERRWRKRQQMDLAIVSAAAILGRLNLLLAEVKVTIEKIRPHFIDNAEAGRNAYTSRLRDCDRWTMDEIAPLVVLPGHVAAKLGYTDRSLRELIDKLRSISDRSNVVDAEFRAQVVKELGVVEKFLSSAESRCQALVRGLTIDS